MASAAASVRGGVGVVALGPQVAMLSLHQRLCVYWLTFLYRRASFVSLPPVSLAFCVEI